MKRQGRSDFGAVCAGSEVLKKLSNVVSEKTHRNGFHLLPALSTKTPAKIGPRGHVRGEPIVSKGIY